MARYEKKSSKNYHKVSPTSADGNFNVHYQVGKLLDNCHTALDVKIAATMKFQRFF